MWYKGVGEGIVRGTASPYLRPPKSLLLPGLFHLGEDGQFDGLDLAVNLVRWQ
jgi:hypothetical protein